jgi:membrane-associated phospholipid phosphatase
MKNIFINLFKNIGSNGPIILFILSIIFLFKKQNLLFYYIIFFIIGDILNIFVKGIIQEPRPSIDNKTFELMMKNKDRFIMRKGLPYDIFGMPSGHSQSVFYSTIFIYLALNDVKITLLYLLISIITIIQRVVYRHHTVLQVIFGSLFGLLVGYISFNMAKKNIQGKLTNKKDDYGPI